MVLSRKVEVCGVLCCVVCFSILVVFVSMLVFWKVWVSKDRILMLLVLFVVISELRMMKVLLRLLVLKVVMVVCSVGLVKIVDFGL